MDELCRKCGESLREFSFCIRCKESIQQICSVCERKTEEQYHKDCAYQLYILKLFPIPPDKAFERHKISVVVSNDDSNKVNKQHMKKFTVVLAIEEVLEKMGEPVLTQVNSELYSKYHCHLTDCYENPQHLINVLKDLFGESYNIIIESIEKKLEDQIIREPINEFLAIIKSAR